MYPNPESSLCSGVEDDIAFEFIGRVLGKALFEGITIGPQFARFFLHKLLGRSVNLHHLPSLDPELYKSLMFLKTYEGDVADLCLSFTVSHDLGSGAAEIELIPGGASIAVTAKNRMQYIHLIADWRLNQSIERQSSAFLRGLRDIIPQAWLSTFSAPELQVIISGAARGIDVDDLERHTSYNSGFFSMHPTIMMFWKVMNELSDKDRAALLKFVTSCERPPPNGFRQLEPGFTIVPLSAAQANSLPMASTCFNTLKLPSYSDRATMKAKILIAIHSGAGFEMA
jgi:ubiquitin-protein ligase E3 C